MSISFALRQALPFPRSGIKLIENVLHKPEKFLHLRQILAIERADSCWTERLFIHLTLSGR